MTLYLLQNFEKKQDVISKPLVIASLIDPKWCPTFFKSLPKSTAQAAAGTHGAERILYVQRTDRLIKEKNHVHINPRFVF